MRTNTLLIAFMTTSFAFGSSAFAKKGAAPCPDAVKASIAKAFAGSTLKSCKAEREHGQDQFEAKVTKADGKKAEVDLTADGKILQIEERIAVDSVPATVMKAFAAKYPKAKVDGAEKQTPTAGKPTFELAFATDSGRKEATFTEDGKFVEEE